MAVPASRRLHRAAQQSQLRVERVSVGGEPALMARAADRRRLHTKRRQCRLQNRVRGVAVRAYRSLHISARHGLAMRAAKILVLHPAMTCSARVRNVQRIHHRSRVILGKNRVRASMTAQTCARTRSRMNAAFQPLCLVRMAGRATGPAPDGPDAESPSRNCGSRCSSARNERLRGRCLHPPEHFFPPRSAASCPRGRPGSPHCSPHTARPATTAAAKLKFPPPASSSRRRESRNAMFRASAFDRAAVSQPLRKMSRVQASGWRCLCRTHQGRVQPDCCGETSPVRRKKYSLGL